MSWHSFCQSQTPKHNTKYICDFSSFLDTHILLCWPGHLWDICRRRHLRSATQHHLTVGYHVTGSALSVVRPSLLQVHSPELATGQSLWPGAQQQQLQTIAEDESILSSSFSTHSALYKSIIDTDNDTDRQADRRMDTSWQHRPRLRSIVRQKHTYNISVQCQ